MIKATLTKSTAGQYLLETESGRVVDLGRRHPSAKRQRSACRPAIGEEVRVVDASTGDRFPAEFCIAG
jgi:hypothetical protein